MFKQFLTSKKDQLEFFAIADITTEYVKLIVVYYYLSAFYVIFNQRFTKPTKMIFWSTSWQGIYLKNLIKKAEQELGITLKTINYNLPTEQLRIKNAHTYYHRFSQPQLLTPQDLNTLTNRILTSKWNRDGYLNFSFHPQTYFQPDKQITTTVPPFDDYIAGLQVKGVLYQINWRILNQYLEVFRFLKHKPDKPVLLPYAIYVNAVLLFKSKTVLILLWTDQSAQLFLFQDHVFVQQHAFDASLQKLFLQLAEKFNISYETATRYFYHTIQLQDTNLSAFDKLILQKEPRLQRHYQQFVDICTTFLQQKFALIMNFCAKNWQLKPEDTHLLLVGKLTQVSYMRQCLMQQFPQINLKLLINNFVGLNDYRDHFLIGNAYYQHLQKKMQADLKR